MNDLWRETGALDDSITIVDPETYVTIRLPDGEDFIIYSDIDRWEKYLLEMAPWDRIAIGQMCTGMPNMATMQMGHTIDHPEG